MFEWDDDEDRWGAVHHPFTRPTDEWRDRFDDGRGGARVRLRPDRERQRARWRLVQDPRARAPGARLRPARALARGAARQVRLPARRARDGRAADGRHRARDRPDDDGARRRAEPARRDRLPEEPGRTRPDERRALRGHAEQLDELGIRLVEEHRRERRSASGSRRSTALAFLAALVAIAVVERSRVDGEALPAARGRSGARGRLVRRRSQPPGAPRATPSGRPAASSSRGVARRDPSRASVRGEAPVPLRRGHGAHRGDRQPARQRGPPVRAHPARSPAGSGSTARSTSTGASPSSGRIAARPVECVLLDPVRGPGL